MQLIRTAKNIVKKILVLIGLRKVPPPPPAPLFSYRGFSIPVELVNLTGAGPDTFEEISNQHRLMLEKYAPVKPDHNVLEIGCGIGRDAFVLCEILGAKGSYTGTDIIKKSIDWCQANITPRFPNFRFIHHDVLDQLHNPSGTITSREIIFPLADQSTQRIILQSVFTHMFEPDIVHYLSEFKRILSQDGLILASFFIVNEEILEIARKSKLTPYDLTFHHDLGNGCFISNPEVPAGAVAYTPEAIQRFLDAAGLCLTQPIHHGFWSGAFTGSDFGQDILIIGRIDQG
jgi:ubiquinone/menaquinone biosynthesis C-methylase UbiE